MDLGDSVILQVRSLFTTVWASILKQSEPRRAASLGGPSANQHLWAFFFFFSPQHTLETAKSLKKVRLFLDVVYPNTAGSNVPPQERWLFLFHWFMPLIKRSAKSPHVYRLVVSFKRQTIRRDVNVVDDQPPGLRLWIHSLIRFEPQLVIKEGEYRLHHPIHDQNKKAFFFM